MATHSRVLPGESPGTEAPGGLQPIGSQRVGNGCSDLADTHGINWNVKRRLKTTERQGCRNGSRDRRCGRGLDGAKPGVG